MVQCCMQALLSGQLASDAATDAGTAMKAEAGRAAAATCALSVDRQVTRNLALPRAQKTAHLAVWTSLP